MKTLQAVIAFTKVFDSCVFCHCQRDSSYSVERYLSNQFQILLLFGVLGLKNVLSNHQKRIFLGKDDKYAKKSSNEEWSSSWSKGGNKHLFSGKAYWGHPNSWTTLWCCVKLLWLRIVGIYIVMSKGKQEITSATFKQTSLKNTTSET